MVNELDQSPLFVFFGGALIFVCLGFPFFLVLVEAG